MRKLQFIAFIFITMLFSCKNEESNIDLTSLKEEVSKNQNYIAYKQALNDIMLSGLNREISFKNADNQMVKNNLDKAKSLQDFKDLYNKAGIVGGDKLATLQYNYVNNLTLLIKDIPELKEISRAQLKEILKFKPSATKDDVEKSANSILNLNN